MLLKQIYRYTHPRTYKHNKNFWPFCKITRALTGEINSLYYKGELVSLVSLSKLRNIFNNTAVLIIASGPSINQIDFSTFPAELTIAGVNGAYVLKDRLIFKLYIIVDTNFIDKRVNILKDIIADYNLILFITLNGIIHIINQFTLKEIHCKIALIENACYRIFQPEIPYNKIKRYFNQNPHIHFSYNYPNIAFTTDILNGIFDAGTVVYWVLQILLYLGFKQIYIAGLDMNNFHMPRFYETEQDILPSFLAKKFDEIIIPAFTLASKVLQKHNVEIKNFSLNSALSHSIINKICYYDVFKF